MTGSDLFLLFFNNLIIFLFFMGLSTIVLNWSVRTIAPAGHLDPLNFFWSFTFGTAYGVVIALYFLDFIESYIFFVVMAYGAIFIMSFRWFIRIRVNPFRKNVFLFLIPKGSGYFEFLIAFVSLAFLSFFLMWQTGLGISADTNRFEQNKGFGFFVRVVDTLRLFVLAYLFLIIYKKYKKNDKLKLSIFLLSIFLVIAVVLSAMLNGAKFALLESVYACVLAFTIYYSRPQFKFVYIFAGFCLVFAFAMITLSINLEKTGFDRDSGPTYILGSSDVLERMLYRIISNGDVYYMTLPNNVIEKLKTDNIVVRFAAPLLGSGRLSSFLGYDVNSYSVGRQALLYFDSNYSLAGGPTSHFDLFAYKYFGIAFGWIWVIFSAFLLASILVLTRVGRGNLFYSALVATLYIRSLSILLEPAVGVAYIFDVVVIFSLIKVFGKLVPRKGRVDEVG